MVNKNRALYIFKYLWDHTDEEHPATILRVQIDTINILWLSFSDL